MPRVPREQADERLLKAMESAQEQGEQSRPRVVEAAPAEAPAPISLPPAGDNPADRLNRDNPRIEAFGQRVVDPGQTDRMVQLAIRVPASKRAVVRAWANELNMTVQELVEIGIDMVLAEAERRYR